MNDIQGRISAVPSGAVLFEARLAAGLIHNFDGIFILLLSKTRQEFFRC
jgi:hypothetical protein